MKRILIVDHPQFTSATYFLWAGLRELEDSSLTGELEISVYPYIPTHFDEPSFNLESLPWFRSLSELVEQSKKSSGILPPGIPPFHPTETLTAMGVTTISRNENCPRLFHKRNLMETEQDVVAKLNAGFFDLVVLGNSHRTPTILLARLVERVQKMPPIIYLDGGERDELNEHWVHVFRPVLTFKQILTPEVKAKGLSTKIPGYTFKIYPLPLSSPLVDQNIEYFNIPIQWLRRWSDPHRNGGKIFPVFYHMGATWPERQKVMEALNRWIDTDCRGQVSISRGGPTGMYHVSLAMSKLGVTMRGSGRDTTRYWEIPLYQTAMVCDGTMGCIHPYPFEDRKTAFFYRSVEELMTIVPEVVKDDSKWLPVAMAGQAHLKRYHSCAARAVFFLDILDQELGFLDGPLKSSLKSWKEARGWENRPWEGPVV